MKHKITASYPEPLINYILHTYDKQSDKIKINYLKSNRPLKQFNMASSNKEFASGNTVDINAGELLGLSLVALYYGWIAELAKTNNTFQVVTGVEDSVKNLKENLLSDGAIWHDQVAKKMLFQTAMAQGYVPKKTISSEDVAAQINKKIKQRSSYPDDCGLIINVFSESFIFDVEVISKLTDLSSYTDVYLILYKLPSLDNARVIYLSNPGSPELPIKLVRHPQDDQWHFNEG